MLRKLVKTNKFLCGTSLIACFIAGYILGIVSFGLNALNIFLNSLGNILSQILGFTPLPNFLSDVAAFEAVVIALVVPLSFEIVSRISERYQSEVITKQFIEEREIKLLPLLLMINIVLAITLRFFVQNNPASVIWTIFAWITFFFYLFIAVILLLFIRKLKIYMTNFESVLERLYDEAEKLLQK